MNDKTLEKALSIFFMAFLIFFAMSIILGAFWAFIVMLLWNAVMPLFEISQIDFWHAWGIWILSNLLLKGYSYSVTNNRNDLVPHG